MRRLLPAIIALLALPAAGLAADPFPPRKPGLWEVSGDLPQMLGQQMTARRCIGPRGEGDPLARGAPELKDCNEPRVVRRGGELVVDMVCRVEGSRAMTHGVFSGDFQSRYAGRLDTTYAPPLRGVTTSSMNLEARRLGPCLPGQKPGETEMAMTGGAINLQDLLKNLRIR
jgi:uncharacterized protein DUF3617